VTRRDDMIALGREVPIFDTKTIETRFNVKPRYARRLLQWALDDGVIEVVKQSKGGGPNDDPYRTTYRVAPQPWAPKRAPKRARPKGRQGAAQAAGLLLQSVWR
jgi:hypothetical protein